MVQDFTNGLKTQKLLVLLVKTVSYSINKFCFYRDILEIKCFRIKFEMRTFHRKYCQIVITCISFLSVPSGVEDHIFDTAVLCPDKHIRFIVSCFIGEHG